MLISCKCLNFVAAATNIEGSPIINTTTAASLMQAFLHKYPRNFVFYSQSIDLLKQAIGPIPDITISSLNQRDLIYSLTLDIQEECKQSWQISFCINCNVALCAKRLNATAGSNSQILVNSSLITTSEEMAYRKTDKSFSETFGIIIMDHLLSSSVGSTNVPDSFSVGSLSTTANLGAISTAQQRLRQLQNNMRQRLQREVTETDERIQRYKETQFALLKSFREKSEQEFELLSRLLQKVPEQQAMEWLDRQPAALEINEGGSVAARRRNTIGSRREINSVVTPTTPITGHTFKAMQADTAAANVTFLSAMDTSTNNTQPTSTLPGVVRQLSNFDTPPATPEATPMSVGNSPTFRTQTQPTQTVAFSHGLPLQLGRSHTLSAVSSNFQQQFPTPTVEEADDCLFELEGIETNSNAVPARQAFVLSSQASLHRSLSNHQENNMSDVEESDGVEEAEELDLQTSQPIPMRNSAMTTAQMLNFAKSLPIEIANSPMAERTFVPDMEEDELDNTVDIAASIKALAKSVHGEAVFGDLPRPRLRSQI